MIAGIEHIQSSTRVWPRPPRILVVDDEELTIRLLCRVLGAAGYDSIMMTTDALEAVSIVRRTPPDLVVLDLHMPGFDGFEVLQEMQNAIRENDFIPVLVLTGDLISETRYRALEFGATDFLTKPFDRNELTLRIDNMLRMRFLNLAIARDQDRADVTRSVDERDLDEARFEILDALACAAEMRDPAAACHMNAVGELSAKLAHAVGLSGDEARMIGRAARLHDIGKIGVPSCTQVSGNNLSAQQIAAQRDHTLVGARLLGGFKSTLLRVASAIAHHHHERWDGSGYPDGLEGKEIPLPARIVAVADVFDALIHDRPYRKAWSPSAAVELILTGSGTHFDPAVVEAFKSFSWVEQRPEVSLCKA